jgi:cell division protein FtsN
MNKSIKLMLVVLAFFMLMSCSANRDVLVGNTVDIDGFNRPSNIVKYQWSFDTKPPTSRLDPRDFIPSNYHPNVTFIPDVAGRYIIRLTMINNEGSVLHKNFVYTAEGQLDYLASIDAKNNMSKPVIEPEAEKKTVAPLAPKVIEVPVVTEKVVLKTTTVTKTPNEWQVAPIPGQKPDEVKQEPAYSTKTHSTTKVISEDKKTLTPKEVETTPETPATKVIDNSNAKYTLQVSSSTVEAYAIEFRDKLIADGYDAFIQKAEIEGLMRYRIRVGHFATYDEAKIYRQKMLDYTEYEPWVDKLK